MVLPGKFKIALLKTVSSLVAGIFLWNQVTWAGDLINTVLEQQYLEQSQTFAPDYLQSQQAAAESLITQQQANTDYMASQTAGGTSSSTATQEEPIIELQGPVSGGTGSSTTSVATESMANASQTQIQSEPAVISVTTVDGDKINYKGAAIDSIETKDGLVLRNIVLDSANCLYAADIYHADGTVQIVNNGRTSKVITPEGAAYNYNSEELIESVVYADGRTTSYSYVKDGLGNIVETVLTDSEKSCYYDVNNVLKKVLKNDASSIEYQDGMLSRIIKPDNSKYVFAGKGVTSATGTALISVELDEYIDPNQNIYKYEDDKLSYVQMADGNIFYYTEQGDITKRITPDGAVIEYQNGLMVKKTAADGVISTYDREYDSTLETFRLTIRDSSAFAQTYLCDNNGSLTGFGIDLDLPSATPFNKPKEQGISAEGYMQSAGVLVTDGTYLYIKRWGGNNGSDIFEKIGTGYNGTIAGKNYGTLASSYTSYSATYYPDGYIYNPISSNTYSIEKINVLTGARAQVSVPSGLIERSSGKVIVPYNPAYRLITSDGRYIYNIAYHIDNGSTTTYNGWTVKVFDPQANWQVVRTFTIAATSFAVNGLVSDGAYLYLIQWTNSNSAKVAKISLATNSCIGTFTINQSTTGVIGGQYDWVNKKFWMGSRARPDIYRYKPDEINYTPLTAANQELTFKAESVLNSSGVIATDGTYYYVKRWSTYIGTDIFNKIGTGYNGTIAGKNYGTLAFSYTSCSATYYPDGYIYNPISSNAYSIEKINVSTGLRGQVSVASGLIERSTGKVKTGYSLITSDGRYIYNVAYHIDNGSTTTYNGWTVKVFDPQANWQVVKTFTVGASSFYTDGVIADGVYIYFIEWKESDSARITAARLSDGVIVKTWTVNQGQTKVINGQYDWVNNKIVLGALYNNSRVYVYDGLIQKANLGSIDTDGFFGPSLYSSPQGAPSLSTIESDTEFKELVYSQDFKLNKAVKYDGSILSYENGLLKGAESSSGIISYDYILNNSGDINSFKVDRDGIKRIYDKYGNLNQVSDGDVLLNVENNGVKSIQREDGTIVEDATFDSDNNIVSAKITKPDGVVAVYSGGVLTEARQPDGSTFYYDASGNITKLVNSKGLTYLYSAIEEGGQAFTVADLEGADLIQDTEEIVYQKFDSNKRPVQARRKNGAVLNYTYTFDSFGGITSTVISDGAAVTTYDKDNNIEKTEVLPTVENPVSTISEYEYGRIRRVYKGNDLIYSYTYEFDASGNETTVIEDISTGDIKRYTDELLMSVTDKDGLVTSYEYDADEKISISIVAYLGKIINEYTYTYDGDNTIIEDIDGVKRTYDKDNKLAFIEEGGKTYAYAYQNDAIGKEVSLQQLIRVKSEDGAVANYNNGALVSVARPDGSIVRDIVIADSKVTSYTIEKSGIKYFVTGEHVTKETHQDGTIIEYYINGLVSAVTEPNGNVTTYSYEEPATESLLINGARQDITIQASGAGDILTLASYPDPQVPLLMHFEGANGGITTADNSYNNHPVVFNGNARIDAVSEAFNTGALALDGNGDYLTVPDSPDWDFGTGNLTLECWVRLNSASPGQGFITRSADLCDLRYGTDGYLKFTINGHETVMYAWVPTANSWYHLAAVRSGTNCYLFINGTQVGSTGTDSSNISSTNPYNIGYYQPGGHYLNGLIKEVRIANSARYTSNFTPQAAPFSPDQDTKLLLHLDNTGGAVDSSPIPHTGIALNGNAKVDSINPLGTGSVLFDGNGDYLRIPDSPDWDFGTGDFSIDFWTKLNNLSGRQTFASWDFINGNDFNSIEKYNDNRLMVYLGGAVQLWGNTYLSANTWYHIALTRSGNTFTLYLNGSVEATGASAGFLDNVGDLYVGTLPNYSYYVNGSMDEVRVTKGKALWTANFTPPASECNNIIYRQSGSLISNPIEINAVRLDSVSWNESLPQGTDITIQTRTGDTSTPDDGTWSAWSNPLTDPAGSAITSPAAKYLQYKVNLFSSDSNVTPKLIEDADGVFIKINYMKIYKPDDVFILSIRGNQQDVALSNKEIGDILTLASYPDPQVPLLMHFEGANGATTTTDNSYANHPVIFNGNARIDAVSEEFNTGALALDGNGDYLTVPDSPDWDFGTGNLTLECWVRLNSASSGQGFITRNADLCDLRYGADGYLKFTINGHETVMYAWVPTANSWYHLAAVRSGTSCYLFINGTQVGYTGTDSSNISSANPYNIGCYQPNEHYLNGLIKEVRISSSARYTSNFTPQAAPFTSDQNTKLLLHLDKYSGAVDSSPNPHTGIVANGNARIESINLLGKGSVVFDGSGDYLSLPASSDWDFGTGDFTIDGWFKFSDINAYSNFFSSSNNYTNWTHAFFHQADNRIEWNIMGSNNRWNFDPSPNVWYHLAFVRNGTSMAIYANGLALVISVGGTNSSNVTSAGDVRIGRGSGVYDGMYFNGWMDEIRITKGKALWTSNFTPPTSEYNNTFYKTSGSLISNPIEINAVRLDSVSWNESLPQGTDITIQTRTGDTSTPDDGTWSAWSNPLTDPAGSAITSPAAKYLQYKVVMTTADASTTPQVIGDIALQYVSNDGNPVYIVLTKDGYVSRYTDGQELSLATLQSSFTQFIETAADIENRILPDDTIIETKSFEEDSSDITVETTKDNKITYYVSGKVQATYQKYDDNHLELLMEYAYDEEGSLVSVNLSSARDSIDTQIAAARQQIAEERANYLRTLSEQKGLAYTQIRDQVQSIRDQINAQRAQLQPTLYQEVTRSKWVGWWIFGWWETYTETVEVPEVRSALNQLDEQERQLNDEESKAYAALDSEVSAAEQKLVQDESTALTEIANQEKTFQAGILEEEVTPVILEYYRSILGRDPDDSETKSWLAKADYNSGFNADELKTVLMNSDERRSQEAFVASLKNKIKDSLYNYVNSDEAGKGLLLGTLGLVRQDAVGLTKKDADAVLSLLDKQNIHFGRSAFVALGTVLTNNGITYNLEDLALKTVLIDIFTGSLNQFSEGTLLELSMYSLSKAASTYGVTLDNTRLNYDELTQAFNSSGQVIVHLKNNHYVVVTNIAADGKISYIENNKGQNGYTWTVSRQDFENSWTGYAIVQKTSVLPESILAKKISDDTAMRIKGSCLPFLFPLLGMIFGAISGVAAAVVGAIGAIVAGISAVIGPIIAGIGQLITGIAGFMTQIGGALFSAVQFVGTSLLPTIGGWIGGIGSWIGGIGSWIGGGFGLGGIISATGFNVTGLGLALCKTVVLTALSIGVSKGLEALGVNSTISGLLTSFVTGGVGGLFNSGFSALSFITGGIQGLAIQGVNQLGTALGIDPMLTNVISMTAGAFIGAVGNNISPDTGLFNLEGFSTSIGTQVMPSLSSELAYYGITKAGELLGVDPRISYLAGVGIRSTINAGLTHEFQPDVIWGSVQNGFLRGVTSVALEWGAEQLGLSPLIGSLTSAAIAGGLEALLMGQNPVQGIFDTYFRAGVGLLTLGGDGGNNPWLRAAYISQVLDFSRIVQERGIVNALETYSAGFLQQQTINEIWKQGGIADLLAKPNQIEMTTNRRGEVVKRIYTLVINSESDKLISNYIDLSPTYDMLVGFREGNVITHCEFVVGPDGRPQLKNGEREIFNPDGSERIEYVENFNLNKMEYIDKYGTRIGYYVPTAGTSSIVTDANGRVTSGKFVSLITDYSVSTKDNQVTDLSLKRDYAFSETQRTNLLNAGYTEQNLSGFKEIVSIANGVLQYFVLPPDTAIFNINEAEGKAWLDSIEADGRAFWQGAYSLLRDAVAGDPLPQFSSDSAYPYVNIELNLVLPGRSEGIIAGLDLLNIVTGDITSPLDSFVTQNSTWNHNTDYSAQLYAASFDMGYKFVFGGGAKFLLSGEGSNRLDWGNLNTLYSSLNTTNTIGIGFSADTVSIAKSWLVPNATRADHYFLFSPQLSPKELEEYMRIGGISPDMVTVVETSGDFPRQWLGGFSNNVDSNKVKKWDYIKIVSGPDVSLLNPFSSHGVPVRGVLDGGQYIVEVNGIRSADPVSLADIYSYFANRNSSN